MRELHRNYPYSKLNGFIQKYKRKDNTSGVTGVYFEHSSKKWGSRLNYNRKLHWGGKHKSRTEAIRSRLKLEFDVLGINEMPQFDLIPIYIKDHKNVVLIAYKKIMEER